MFPPHHHDNDDFAARYPDPPHAVFTTGPGDMSIPADAFGGFSRPGHDAFPPPTPGSMGFEASLYADTSNYFLANRGSPVAYAEDAEMGLASSSLSTASAPSATSSAIGSPQSNNAHAGPVTDWAHHGLRVHPAIVGGNDFISGTDYSSYSGPGMEDLAFDFPSHNKGYVGELQAASSPRVELDHPSPSPTSCKKSAVSVNVADNLSTGNVGANKSPTLMSPSLVSPFPSSSSQLPGVSMRMGSPIVSPSETSPLPSSWYPALSSLSGGGDPVAARLPPTAFAPSQPSSSLVDPHSYSSWPLSHVLSSSQNFGAMVADLLPRFADPSLILPEVDPRPMNISPYDPHFQQPVNSYPASVSSSPQPIMMRTDSSSPFLHNGAFHPGFPNSPYAAPMDVAMRRPSLGGFISPTSAEYVSSDETKEKQRCADCGKVFKDLKAHMLTHQNERPEKCPIQTCEYHVKGFARKYDKNRHTLTHYKGTMVCGFCPGSGSAAEKSFNRADVFKRHLTAVHGVEQTPPNSRKKPPTGVSSGKKITGYAPDATGKCSTCSQTFSNAQDFYEHLDDCVLRIVQQEDPAEAINAQRLKEVENDKEVHQTLEKNNLPTTTQTSQTEEDEEEFEVAEEEEGDSTSRSTLSPVSKKTNPASGVQKSRGMTHSRGGVPLTTKTRGRKSRRDYPLSWGFDKSRMTLKKRVLCCFDGPRRLAKDDMMLVSTDQMVRIKLSDGESYITDLDAETMRRADGFLNATEAEKGPWLSDDPSEEQIQEMQELLETSSATM